jgi:hypothetical protein
MDKYKRIMKDLNYVANCMPTSPLLWDLEYLDCVIFVAQSVPWQQTAITVLVTTGNLLSLSVPDRLFFAVDNAKMQRTPDQSVHVSPFSRSQLLSIHGLTNYSFSHLFTWRIVRAVAQVVSHWPLTTEAWVRTRVNSCGMWWTKWRWDMLFSECFHFPLSVSFHHGSPCSHHLRDEQ